MSCRTTWDLRLFPHGIFAAGGAIVPTQEKKDLRLYPHGIFSAQGAFVPTQEKKKDLRILGN